MLPHSHVYLADVSPRVGVMVREPHSLHYFICVAQMRAKRTVVGYSAEHDRSLGINVARIRLLREHRSRGVVFGGGEEDGQVLAEAKLFPPLPAFPGVHLVRALADYHDVGVCNSGRQVAKAAEGKKSIFEDGPAVANQHYIEAGVEFLVLEGVVQDYDVRPFRNQLLTAFHAVLVHRHGHGGELALYLQWFISRKRGRTVCLHYLETLALSLVAAGEHRMAGIPPAVAFLQEAQDHLRMRGLSGAADCDVAHAYRGDIRSGGLPPGCGGAAKNQALYQHSVRKYNQESRIIRRNPEW